MRDSEITGYALIEITNRVPDLGTRTPDHRFDVRVEVKSYNNTLNLYDAPFGIRDPLVSAVVSGDLSARSSVCKS